MAMRVHVHTPDEWIDLMPTVIAGAAGGSKARWRRAIGLVEQLPTWCNIHCNRRVQPRGEIRERAMVEQAAVTLRAEDPYIERQRDQARRGRR